jgi:hypothetical protein
VGQEVEAEEEVEEEAMAREDAATTLLPARDRNGIINLQA